MRSARLLRSAGYTTRSFGSASEFLVSGEARFSAGCIILDLAMPGLNGLELQEYLSSSGLSSAHHFPDRQWRHLQKRSRDEGRRCQFPDQARRRARASARRSKKHSGSMQRGAQSGVPAIRVSERLATLTRRERQVFENVVAGRLNKQIAADLGIVEKTIKVHRARMMRKMNAASIVELVHLASLLGVDSWPLQRTRVCTRA